MSSVGFFGLGKLGLPVARAMARHHDVKGYDIKPINGGSVTIVEDFREAIEGCEFIFIAVPTPHDPEYDGSKPTSGLPTKDFDYGIVESVLDVIYSILKPGQNVVIISTCLPGTTRQRFQHLIPPGVTLYYNPYFIAMGTVEEDFLNPEFMLIGTKHGKEEEAKPLIDFYKGIIGEKVPYCPMTWTEAECTKVFYNTFISFKISFVNMIQDIAEVMQDIDVDHVTEALGLGTDRLISTRYMKAGMGDGGPCHPRDNIALSHLVKNCGLGYDLFGAIMQAREKQAELLAQFIHLTCFNSMDVVIVGKSFKPNVPYIDGSYSILVAHYLKELGVTVHWIDPLTGDNDVVDYPCVYLLGHPDTYGVKFVPESIVVDPWRSLEPIDGIAIIPYGSTR